MRLKLKELIWEKQAKESRKITQHTVSKETGVSRPTLIHWSKGRADFMSTAIMETLMDYFDCDLNTMFERIPDEKAG